MACCSRLFCVGGVVVLCAALGSGQDQRLRKRAFPPDVIISPGRYHIELDNPEMVALRAAIPAKSVLSGFGRRHGLIVAVTDVQVRLKLSTGLERDVRLNAGQIQWIDEPVGSIHNLGAADCEFLLVINRTGP